MKIIYKKVNEIIPYENNPRKNDKAVNYVAESIKNFGFRVPIILDNNNVIIAGHTRLKAALKLGMEEVPCIIASDLSPEQVRAYRLADNRVAEFSEWDLDTLDEELRDLEDLYDLESLGFGDFLADAEPQEILDDDFDEDAFVPETPESQLGDLYILGNHKLVCGDSKQKSTFDKLLDGESVDLILTDPPYNIDYTGKTAEELKIKNDKMSEEEFYQFLLKAFTNMYNAAKPGTPCFVFYADKRAVQFRLGTTDAGFKYHQDAIWLKDTFVMGHSWLHYRYEPILIEWKEGAQHYDKADRTLDNVLIFTRPKRSLEHPTMKPLDLIGWLIDFGCPIKQQDGSQSIVLDAFGGSGSTMIACEQSGRACRTIELDPRFVDVEVKRYLRFKGTSEGCYLIRDGQKLALPYEFMSVFDA